MVAHPLLAATEPARGDQQPGRPKVQAGCCQTDSPTAIRLPSTTGTAMAAAETPPPPLGAAAV